MEPEVAGPPARRTWLKIAAALTLLLVVAIIVWQTVAFIRQPPPQRGRFAGAGGAQPVGVATIGRGDVRQTVRALGAVTPLATVTVTSQISGYLMSVAFREGQLVHKGQLLAQIDPRPYQVALEQDRAQLARDVATLEQSKMDLKRYETLANQTSIAKQTYEDQVWIVKTNQGTVDYDRAMVKSQELNLIYCRIVSPTDGRVGLRLVDPGNYVQSGSSTGITMVTTLKPTTVEFAVPEDAVPQIMARVHTGAALPATAFDRANINQLAVGTLFAVDTQVNSTTGTVNLRAQFDNADETLYPQQFVNIELLVDTLKDVVTVPLAAVQRGAPGTYVYLVDGSNVVSAHPIKLGPQDGTFYAVTAGLNPGDRVVTDGADRLRDGAKVTIPASASPSELSGMRHGHAGNGGGRGGPGGTGGPSGSGGNWPHHHRQQPGAPEAPGAPAPGAPAPVAPAPGAPTPQGAPSAPPQTAGQPP